MKRPANKSFDFCLCYLVFHYLPKIKPNTYLKANYVMAEHIGVAMTVYREVLRVLDFHGVVYVHHGKPVKFISLNKPSLIYIMERKGLTGQTT